MENTTSSSITNGTAGEKLGAAAQGAKGMMNEAKGSAQRTTASLRSQLTDLKNDLDSLVTRSTSMSDDELSSAHDELMARFSSVKHAARGMASEATRQWNRGMETTQAYVQDKPMQSVAVAVGAGLVLGMLFGRR